MIEFQSLISLFDGFNSTVKFVENCRRVAAIIRGEPDKIDVALQHLENINNKLEVVRLSEHIVQVPSIQSVRDITQTRQRQIELTEVRESLDPLQRALNSDLLASAMILTPDKMRHAMGKNPWEVLEDISPVNLARPHYDPDKVPIIFEHQSVRYLGWLKRGLLPVVFDCQFEDLPLNVPKRPEIITPPPIISTSNNEEQRLQQLRNQTAELERQRKLAEQRRENQIKTREEQKQLQAQMREEQAKQYVLQHGELSAWNPLDWWRLLVWSLWSPIYLKIHREVFGKEREKYIGSWLMVTLTWLPLLLMNSAFILALIPSGKYVPDMQYLVEIIIFSLWFLTGVVFSISAFYGFLTHNANIREPIFASIATGVSMSELMFLISGIIMDRGTVSNILMSVSMGYMPFLLAIMTEELFKNSLETGKPSYLTRFGFISLIVNYAFIVWIFYLQGWQYFQGWQLFK